MDFEDEQLDEQPSKTRRKQESHALQAIGGRLIGFSEVQLDKLPLSAPLRNAIREYRRLPNSHGAKRRQLQYIGRLMRDYQLDEIESAIDQLLQPPPESPALRHLLESSCERVFAEGDPGITQLLEEHPHLERQTLRQYFLEYQKATRNEAPEAVAKIRRDLIRYLRRELQ